MKDKICRCIVEEIMIYTSSCFVLLLLSARINNQVRVRTLLSPRRQDVPSKASVCMVRFLHVFMANTVTARKMNLFQSFWSCLYQNGILEIDFLCLSAVWFCRQIWTAGRSLKYLLLFVLYLLLYLFIYFIFRSFIVVF